MRKNRLARTKAGGANPRAIFFRNFTAALLERGIHPDKHVHWVAERFDCSRTAASRWLNGDTLPEPELWQWICESVEMPMEKLFFDHEAHLSLSRPRLTALTQLVRHLDDEIKRAMFVPVAISGFVDLEPHNWVIVDTSRRELVQEGLFAFSHVGDNCVFIRRARLLTSCRVELFVDQIAASVEGGDLDNHQIVISDDRVYHIVGEVRAELRFMTNRTPKPKVKIDS
jgi:transcriptional regulator with XRE-family HTH domain